MDKSELTKIVVTAVITVAIREFVGLIFSKTKTTVNTLKPAATSILKRHKKILPVLLDLYVIFFVIYSLYKFAFDAAPASRRFVIYIIFLCFMGFRMFYFLKRDFRNYITDLRIEDVRGDLPN